MADVHDSQMMHLSHRLTFLGFALSKFVVLRAKMLNTIVIFTHGTIQTYNIIKHIRVCLMWRGFILCGQECIRLVVRSDRHIGDRHKDSCFVLFCGGQQHLEALVWHRTCSIFIAGSQRRRMQSLKSVKKKKEKTNRSAVAPTWRHQTLNKTLLCTFYAG